jgi:hypothetical protein
LAELAEEILDGVDRLVVEADDDVAGLEAGLGRRGAVPHLHDQDAGGLVQAELGGDLAGDRGGLDAGFSLTVAEAGGLLAPLRVITWRGRMVADRFDVVVVGAGPAGCVLANRLTQELDRSVCVLEAGPDYGPDPAGWPADLRDPTLVWYQSHPWGYQHAGRPPDRPLPLPRARVVGGSSTVNACYWLRGSAADYDRWAALGNPGWSFAELLPFFRRAEADPLGGPLHGSDGPVPVFRAAARDLTAVDRAFLAAAQALGLPDQTDSPNNVRVRSRSTSCASTSSSRPRSMARFSASARRLVGKMPAERCRLPCW